MIRRITFRSFRGLGDVETSRPKRNRRTDDRCYFAARVIAERISLEPGIQVVNDVFFNQLVCRFGFELSSRNTDELTVRVIHRLQREGIIFATGAK